MFFASYYSTLCFFLIQIHRSLYLPPLRVRGRWATTAAAEKTPHDVHKVVGALDLNSKVYLPQLFQDLSQSQHLRRPGRGEKKIKKRKRTSSHTGTSFRFPA